MPYNRPSRRDEGFSNYLERTAEKHNSFGVAAFQVFYGLYEQGKMTLDLFMLLMNIKTYKTMHGFIADYLEEQKHAEKNTRENTRPAFIQQPD